MKGIFVILISLFFAACNTDNSGNNNSNNGPIVSDTKNPSQMNDAQLRNYKGKVQTASARVCPKVELYNGKWEVKEIAPEAFIDSFSTEGKCVRTYTLNDYHTPDETIYSSITFDKKTNRFDYIFRNQSVGYYTDTFITPNVKKTIWSLHIGSSNELRTVYDSFSNDLLTHEIRQSSYTDGKMTDSTTIVNTFKGDTLFEETNNNGVDEHSFEVILQRDNIGNPVRVLTKNNDGVYMIMLSQYTYY